MRVLTWIGAFLHWLEELVTMASGPLLTAGLAIALIDLLTDGQLLASQPALLYGWAVSQAIGVDGQLVGASVKAGRAARRGAWLQMAAYVPLIAGLAYVAYLASNVFATQQALGLTTHAALTQLGMSPTLWIVARSGLAVFLVILSGFLRFEATKTVFETPAERAERQARELQDAQHKAALMSAKMRGLAGAARAAVQAATQDHSETIAADEADTMNDPNDGQSAQDSAEDGEPDARTMRARERGRSAAPAGLMSAPEFARYLRDSGVPISDDEARKTVRNAKRWRQVGATYYADKRALNAIAKRRINEAHPTIQLVG